MQVGRIISAPVQKVGNTVSKMGKVTKAAVLAATVGAAAVYGGTTNNVQQATTKAPATLKAVGGVGGFSPTVYGTDMTFTGMTVNKDKETLTLEYRLVQKPNALKLGWKKELTDKNWEFVKEDLPYKESGVDALGRTNYVGSVTVDKKDPHKGFYRLIDSGLKDK